MQLSEHLIKNGLVPDSLIRAHIRKLIRKRLSDEAINYKQRSHFENLLNQMESSPIAIHTADANQQHYEVPTVFFQKILGRNLKYSSCYWEDSTPDLHTAELAALEITCERAQLQDGQRILELGCGWGSLSMYMAQRYPESQIVSVSNSSTQKKFIIGKCAELGIQNLQVITADMNAFEAQGKFDRVVSVEMFEHMRNWKILLSKISRWLENDGKLFIHIFTHKSYTYFYEVRDSNDWMAKYFFTGGIMPGDNLLQHFPEIFQVKLHWVWNGLHYAQTANAWLQNMDNAKEEIIPMFKQVYGAGYKQWWNYWRIFFIACEELWQFNNGNEWLVSHYLLDKKI